MGMGNRATKGELVRWLALLVLSTLMSGSCARLPEYARPRIDAEISTDGKVTNGFPYRMLTVSDFASSLPPERNQPGDSIKAESHISIRPSQATSITISRIDLHGQTAFTGKVVQIGFEAVFDPAGSWWSPDLDSRLHDYVLQHEQIHFALSALTARRITEELGGRKEEFIAFGRNHAEVQESLAQTLQQEARRIVEQDLAIHTAFDEDTSMFHNPEGQNEWYVRVTRDLDADY